MDSVYYFAIAANIHMDQILKDVNAAYASVGGFFGPVFNIDGTKVLFQLKGNFAVPANAVGASTGFGDRKWLTANLSAAEWQSRIYPPDALSASYFAGTINLGQFLTQVRAITPQQIRVGG